MFFVYFLSFFLKTPKSTLCPLFTRSMKRFSSRGADCFVEDEERCGYGRGAKERVQKELAWRRSIDPIRNNLPEDEVAASGLPGQVKIYEPVKIAFDPDNEAVYVYNTRYRERMAIKADKPRSRAAPDQRVRTARWFYGMGDPAQNKNLLNPKDITDEQIKKMREILRLPITNWDDVNPYPSLWVGEKGENVFDLYFPSFENN